MSIAAFQSPLAPPIPTPGPLPPRSVLAPMPLARGAALVALAVFGSLHWMRLLEPAAPFRAWEAVGLALPAMVTLVWAGRLEQRWARWAVAGATAAVATLLALLAAGMADEYLRPDRWGSLLAGVGRGLETLPGARVPFRGVDEWTRVVIASGGTLLVVLAACLAFWPRSRGRTGFRGGALVALVALYVVPTVALVFDREFLRGALLVLLMLAFLRLERVHPRDARSAGVAGLGVAVLALGVAPVLDGPSPWWDYETWALSAATSKTTAFSWDHDYGPLDWPRDGRELLRVRPQKGVAAYWKAENLDVFDGQAWRRTYFSDSPERQTPGASADPASARKWSQKIRVSVRNLRSREVITAGVATAVDVPPRGTLTAAPGVFVTAGRPLRRGDVYTAEVYAPDPSPQQMRLASADYEDWHDEYLTVGIGGGRGVPGGLTKVRFQAFPDVGDPVIMEVREPNFPESAARELEASPLARTWELAQRLKADSETPYRYVRQVENYLRLGFSYTERPPRSAETLDGFLFDAKQGFCQQYSGAMALLLRMGGVPARVSAGFTSGSLDRKTNEYVVRDLDAHSWVEAWFPGYGWVTFDPTPSAAPPRNQSDDVVGEAAAAAAAQHPDLGAPLGETGAVEPLAGGSSGPPWNALVLGLAALALAVSLHRRRPSVDGEPWRASVAELERALRRAGWHPPPGLTLNALEKAFSSNPGAAGYVRALREQRYRGGTEGPTAGQRRRLRSELARGMGLGGRLRAWWALPPRV